jgi:hypothetical protein
MFSLFIRRDGLIDPPPMGGTDAHCHVLPGIDDGPKDEHGSLAIARLLCEMGVHTVVATPHVISDVYPNSTDRIVGAVDKLRRLLSASGLGIEVVAGAEYYAEPELVARAEKMLIARVGHYGLEWLEEASRSSSPDLREVIKRVTDVILGRQSHEVFDPDAQRVRSAPVTSEERRRMIAESIAKDQRFFEEQKNSAEAERIAAERDKMFGGS